MLDGILRGDYQKWLGERQRAAVHRHLSLVHGFEESGLGARGGAVDFVGEDDVGEDGALAKFEFAGFGIVDADAEDVTGQKIRSELDTLKGAMEGFCKRLGQSG